MDILGGYAGLAVVIAIVFVTTILITVGFVKDRSCYEAASGEKAQRITLKEAIHVITGNDQLKVYIAVVLAYNMLVQLAGGMALYYFKYVCGNEDLFPYFTTAASAAEIIALFAHFQASLLREILPHAVVIHDFPGGGLGKHADYSAVSRCLDVAAYNNYPVWGGQKEPLPPPTRSPSAWTTSVA